MRNLNMTNINNDKNRFRLAHFWFNSSKNVRSVRMGKEHIFRSLKYYAFHISYRVHNNYKTIFQTCFQVTILFYAVSTSGFNNSIMIFTRYVINDKVTFFSWKQLQMSLVCDIESSFKCISCFKIMLQTIYPKPWTTDKA